MVDHSEKRIIRIISAAKQPMEAWIQTGKRNWTVAYRVSKITNEIRYVPCEKRKGYSYFDADVELPSWAKDVILSVGKGDKKLCIIEMVKIGG